MAAHRLLLLLLAAALASVGVVHCAASNPKSGSALPYTCPRECPRFIGSGTYEYHNPITISPLISNVTVTYTIKTTIARMTYSRKDVVTPGETLHLSSKTIMKNGRFLHNLPASMMTFSVSDPIWFCFHKNSVDAECFTITITTTTTTSTTATTTTTTTTTSQLPEGPQQSEESAKVSQDLETFLVILSVASVLLRLLFVAKGTVAYCRTLTGLDRSIAAARFESSNTSLRLLHALRDAVVLDFGLRLCLCLLLGCVCVFAYSLYLILTLHAKEIYIPIYILGAACLLLHGFFCIRKVNGAISLVLVPQQKPRPASRRHRHSSNDGDSIASGCSEEVPAACPSQTVTAVLKGCLLLLLLCLCPLSYCMHLVVTVD